MFYFTDYICGIIIKKSLPNWGTHKNIFSFRRDQTGHCPADVHWGLRDNAVHWSPLSPVPQCLPVSLDTDPLGLGGSVTAFRCPLNTNCVPGISLDTMITVSDLLDFQCAGGEKWVSTASSGINKCAEGKNRVFQWVGQCGQRRPLWGADSWVETWMIG